MQTVQQEGKHIEALTHFYLAMFLLELSTNVKQIITTFKTVTNKKKNMDLVHDIRDLRNALRSMIRSQATIMKTWVTTVAKIEGFSNDELEATIDKTQNHLLTEVLAKQLESPVAPSPKGIFGTLRKVMHKSNTQKNKKQ